MTTRRDFLKGMIAVAAAPAIVKASSLMKIYMPPERKVLTFGRIEGFQFIESDFREVWANDAAIAMRKAIDDQMIASIYT